MIGDDVAFSHSLNRMHGTKADGAKADLWFRQTFGFQRIKGEWKMAHEHESVPFTWMAASKPQSTLSRSWAASLEQMNKGETGQSNGEKTTSAKKKFKTADEIL
jgi:SnoaL-like domain